MKLYAWPAAMFVLISIIGIGARAAIGNVYGAAEAVDLLQALSRAGLYLGAAVATASATTLALMLTLIGTIRRADTDFDTSSYHRVTVIAGLSTVTLVMSLLLLLAFVLPVGHFEALPVGWYETLYNVMFSLCVGMVALLAATVVVTFMTVRSVIAKITPGREV